jgi:hypothetical protein
VAKTNLLKYFPRPLLDDLAAGRWLPIVGAGMSRNADVEAGSPGIPDWSELGKVIAEGLGPEYGGSGPVESISAYEHAFGRNKLVEKLTEALGRGNPRPGAVHRAFCELPFDFVVTTNAEQILEAGYRERHGDVLAVVEESQLRLKNPYLSPTLVKLHGDIHHPDSLVFSENDYDAFTAQRPLFVTWLANQLISKTGILIGYSLDDPDFRAINAQLRSRLGQKALDLYAIALGKDPVRDARFARRGVRIIELPKSQGYGILAELFSQLLDYWNKELGRRISSPNGALRALLRAGSRTKGVVLFLVESSRLSFYEEFVYPPLLEQSMIPISRSDVSDDSGSPVAVIDTLLRVANTVVVELDATSGPLVARLASVLGNDHVIEVTAAPRDKSGPRPTVTLTDDWESFSASLVTELGQVESPVGFRSDTIRSIQSLAAAQDFRAACLIGLVELEATLRSRLDVPPGATYMRDRFVGFRALLIQARDFLQLPISAEEVDTLVNARNLMVHGPSDLGDRNLRLLYGRILELLQFLN